MNVGYVVSNSGTISLQMDSKLYSIGTDHINYKAIKQALAGKEYTKLCDLVDVGRSITKAFGSNASNNGNVVEVRDGVVYYKNNPLHNCLTDRIISLMQSEFPIDPLVKFLANLMANPSNRAVNELYSFLEDNKLPITDDGCFMAYKRVNGEYMDFHTHTLDNHVGKTVSMERNQVNEDKDQTCSTGLHFCSLAYLKEYHGGEGHIIIVKINPKDVVSIPSDYHNTKGRCCEYVVLSQYDKEDMEAFDKPLYNSDGSAWTGEDYDTANDGAATGSDADDESDNESLEYDEGQDDYADGYRVDENPYDEQDDPDMHEDWERGWLDAGAGDNSKTVAKGTGKANAGSLGKKPDGSNYWNVRDAAGHFRPKMGRKPDGKAYHNVRDAAGHFTKRS